MKKKVRKLQSAFDSQMTPSDSTTFPPLSTSKEPKGRSPNNMTSTKNPHNYPNIYASSTQNISRLLEGWMKPSSSSTSQTKLADQEIGNEFLNDLVQSVDFEFESVLSYDNGCWDKMMSGDYYQKGGYGYNEKAACILHERKLHKQESLSNAPLTFFERWLLDESASQIEGAIQQQVT